MGNVVLTTNDSFGVAVDSCAVQFTQPVEDGTQLDSDLWLLSDINAEKATDDTCQFNRAAYHASVVHRTHAIRTEKALVLGLTGLSDPREL